MFLTGTACRELQSAGKPLKCTTGGGKCDGHHKRNRGKDKTVQHENFDMDNTELKVTDENTTQGKCVKLHRKGKVFLN